MKNTGFTDLIPAPALLLNHNPQTVKELPNWLFYPVLNGEYWVGSDSQRVTKVVWSKDLAVKEASSIAEQ